MPVHDTWQAQMKVGVDAAGRHSQGGSVAKRPHNTQREAMRVESLAEERTRDDVTTAPTGESGRAGEGRELTRTEVRQDRRPRKRRHRRWMWRAKLDRATR